jgi:phosphonate degradation associated HDIG domain protein
MQLDRPEDFIRLFRERGDRRYGEDVTQTEHALQCAALAEADGAAETLIAAALLHDVGHLLEDESVTPPEDFRHEALGAGILRRVFPEAVWRPVALHVAAKRWLCFAEPAYATGLSAASQHSLSLQGGPYDVAEAERFTTAPYWREAVRLRRFDDAGKDVEARVKGLKDYENLLERVAS